MEEKKILNEEELEKVVGGFANENDIKMAFYMAADDFTDLSANTLDMESKSIVDQMRSKCMYMSKITSSSEGEVNSVIKRLEELCSSLVNVANTRNIPDVARDILNKLKGSLGL